jgi:dehydrodolichyl diphosphate syntase complex subunit NUS1
LFKKARLFWKQLFSATPKPLQAPRRRIPKHLAVVFIIDPNIYEDTVQTALIESALNIIEWCQTTGIPKLTLYEEHDRLSKCVQILQERLSIYGLEGGSSESETEYLITPPPSDYSDSRPLSPKHHQAHVTTIHVSQHSPSQEARNLEKQGKRRSHQKGLDTCRHALTLCLVSRQSAKPAIASAAQSLAQAQAQIRNRRPRKANHSRTSGTFQLSIEQFDELLENEDGLSSPDFMIVQPLNLDPSRYSTTAIELRGFSPWHIRLTEIYQNNKSSRFWVGKGTSSASYFPPPLDEFSFREALDEFASAEMRLGT